MTNEISGGAAVPRPPSKAQWAAELPRMLGTIASIPKAWPELMKAPPGDGRPIMLLPGWSTPIGRTW